MYLFTKDVCIKFICEKCKATFWKRNNIPITPIINTEHLMGYISKNNPDDIKGVCPQCKEPSIKIMAIECAPHKDMCSSVGNITSGEWVCDNGHTDSVHKIYPGRIRMARDSVDIVCSTDDLKYRQIVSMGLPWKCPVCKKALRYTETRQH